MNAEKLKVIAEGMGYKHGMGLVHKVETLFIWTKIEGAIYNPLTNNDQCMEIMERLQTDIEYMNCTEFTGVVASICRKGHDYEGRGKTLSEAVCNAAYEGLLNESI